MDAIIVEEMIKAYGPPGAALILIATYLLKSQKKEDSDTPSGEIHNQLQFIRDMLIKIDTKLGSGK